MATLTMTACDPPGGTPGIWTSRSELAALPMSGTAWTDVRNAAHGSWGVASLSDNDAEHDTFVLAGALVAVRSNDAALAARTRAGIMEATRSDLNRVLELSRNITSYVIAADIVGLSAHDDATFRSFISGLRTRPLSGHGGGTNLYTTALRSSNNWGAMSRAAMTAIDLYLGDDAQLRTVADAHRAWIGEAVANQISYSDTNWHTAPVAGINRRGATIDGHSVDGVIAEDQRRTGEFSWPAAAGNYPHGALGAEVVAAAMLHRAGVVPFRAGDDALVRAEAWLRVTNSNPASGDDLNTAWIINDLAGTQLPTASATAGKNIAWSDWTHG